MKKSISVNIPYMNLYVLQLQNGKYYVGTTHNVKKRYEMHKNGNGAEWTKCYPPVKILYQKQFAFCDPRKALHEEDEKTVELMFKYGKDNVRGGKYVAVEQTVIDELLGEDLCNKIDQRFRTITMKQLRNKEKDNKGKYISINGKECLYTECDIVYYDEHCFGDDFSLQKIKIEITKKNGKKDILYIPMRVDEENCIIYVNKKYQKYI